MKKTFANLVQKSLVVALLVVGALLVSATHAEAQSSGAEQWPTSWVDAGEAMLRIKLDVESLNNDPQVNAVGTDIYIRAHYFKFVYRRLEGGEPVHSAISNPLYTDPALGTADEAIPGVTLNPGQRNDLLNYMKNRLSL